MEKVLRVVWKDTGALGKKPVKYRGHYVTGCDGGWAIDIPGDHNIYRTHYCALNAIDAALGGAGIRGKGTPKRQAYGIQIVGKRSDATA